MITHLVISESGEGLWGYGKNITMVRILLFRGLGIPQSPFLSPWDLGTTPPKING